MNKKIASKVLETTNKCSTDLSELVPYLKNHCKDKAEYEIYAKKVAKVMASIFYEINSPLYDKYPDLNKSKELD